MSGMGSGRVEEKLKCDVASAHITAECMGTLRREARAGPGAAQKCHRV